MSAVWMRFRAGMRTRWRAWLGLALLVGCAGGAILAIAAGARRTDSAYPRYLVAHRSADALVINYPGFSALFDFDEVDRLPMVTDSARGAFTYGPFGGGTPMIASNDGRIGSSVDRLEVLEGRLPAARRADEIVVGFALADRFGIRVGSRVPANNIEIPRPGSSAFQAGSPEEQVFARRFYDALPNGEFRVVGIVSAPGMFPPQHRDSICCIIGSRAFAESGLAEAEILLVGLRRGAADFERFAAHLEQLAAGQGEEIQVAGSEQDGEVDRSIGTQVTALWILAGLTALAFVLIVGQLLARLSYAEGGDDRTLSAFGMIRRQRFATGMLRAVAIAVAGAVVAVAVALIASPLFPSGLARTAEPDPGLRIDGTVLIIGALAIVGTVAAAAAWPTWVSARIGSSERADVEGRSSRAFTGGARSGVAAPLSVGAWLALNRGRGTRSVPVVSSVSAVTLGIAALVSAVTFGASLDHLLDTPRLYGATWDLSLTNFGDESQPPVAERLEPVLRRHPNVTAYSVGDATGAAARVNGTRVDAVVFGRRRGNSVPPVIEGLQPTTRREIALGRTTADELGVSVRDRVAVALGETSKRYRVVGIAVLPEASERAQLGRGAYITPAGATRLTGEAAGELGVFMRLTEGTDVARMVDDLEAAYCDGVEDDYPSCSLATYVTAQAPTDIVNFGRARNVPLLIGGVLAVLAGGTLAHVVVTAVRQRRRQLALLKVLGFTRRQLAAAVAMQASTITVIALAIGVPLGLIAGRWLWHARADSLGIDDVPVLPATSIALVVVAALLCANVVAALPARAAARVHPAEALKAE